MGKTVNYLLKSIKLWFAYYLRMLINQNDYIIFDLRCQWWHITLFKSWNICFSIESCIVTSYSIFKLKKNPSRVLFIVIMKRAVWVWYVAMCLCFGKRMGRRHLPSMLWSSADGERALAQMYSEQLTAKSNAPVGRGLRSIIVFAWLKDLILTSRNELPVPLCILP